MCLMCIWLKPFLPRPIGFFFYCGHAKWNAQIEWHLSAFSAYSRRGILSLRRCFFFHSNCNLSKSIEFPLNPIGCVNMYSVFFSDFKLADWCRCIFFIYTKWWSRETRMKTIKLVYSSLIVYFSLANFYWQSSLVHGTKGEKN